MFESTLVGRGKAPSQGRGQESREPILGVAVKGGVADSTIKHRRRQGDVDLTAARSKSVSVAAGGPTGGSRGRKAQLDGTQKFSDKMAELLVPW